MYYLLQPLNWRLGQHLLYMFNTNNILKMKKVLYMLLSSSMRVRSVLVPLGDDLPFFVFFKLLGNNMQRLKKLFSR